MLDYAEIVADKQTGESQIGAQLHEEIEDLRLDGNIERGHRFIADKEFRIHCERTSDSDALALAAGELMRKSSLASRIETDPHHQVIDIVVERTSRDAGHDILAPGAPPIRAGGFHAVMIDPGTGTLIGGADPRRGGLAVAY